MCIAVYKPQGVKMPSKKIFSNCFSSNDDGAGFMFPVNGKVHYEKGFMSFTAFKRGLKSSIKKYGISTKDTPMVFHFRITSQGGVKPELTHPFPLTRSFEEMRALKGDVDVAVVHNGIIDFASSYAKNIDYSDTMEFTKEVLYPLINRNTKYYDNKALMGLLNYLLSGNRFVIMDKSGHVELIGNWQNEGGVYYSNSSYQTKYGLFSNVGSFKRFGSSDVYAPEYGADFFMPCISLKQEKDFLETGVIKCEYDDKEMTLEYDYEEDRVVAICYECGETLKLTPKAEAYAWNHGLVAFDRDYYDEVDDWNSSFYGKDKKYSGGY